MKVNSTAKNIQIDSNTFIENIMQIINFFNEGTLIFKLQSESSFMSMTILCHYYFLEMSVSFKMKLVLSI